MIYDFSIGHKGLKVDTSYVFISATSVISERSFSVLRRSEDMSP